MSGAIEVTAVCGSCGGWRVDADAPVPDGPCGRSECSYRQCPACQGDRCECTLCATCGDAFGPDAGVCMTAHCLPDGGTCWECDACAHE